MLNCSLTKNISKECTTHISGIFDKIYLYDIDYVNGITFGNDTRFDSGESVSEINSSQQFYVWDVSDGEYTEEVDGDEYSHEVVFNIHQTQEIEDILSDAKNGRFLVAFKLKSEYRHRLVGWNLGLKLSYTLTVGEEGNYYTITFSNEGVFPSFECDNKIFKRDSMVFEPIYCPEFDMSLCEISSGAFTGYRIALYVTKQNTAGEALDVNNQLCEYSGLQQCAYKYTSAPDGLFVIEGTYSASAVYNGQAVKIYDKTHCQESGTGTITVVPSTYNIAAHTDPQVTLNVTTEDRWFIDATNSYFTTATPMSGLGDGKVILSWNGKTTQSNEVLFFYNIDTNEKIEVRGSLFCVNVTGDDIIPYKTLSALYNVVCYGGTKEYSVEVYCSTQAVKYHVDYNIYGYISVFIDDYTSIPENGATITLKVIHNDNANEVCTKRIKLKGGDPTPKWVEISRECELYKEEKTGYAIVTYQDKNPLSQTYEIKKKEKVLAKECTPPKEIWVTLGSYCELNSEGANTGNLITVELQTNPDFPDTYNTERTTTKEDKEKCPIESKIVPKWELTKTYCETDTYGQTGVYVKVYTDVNEYSETYRQTKNVTTVDETTCVPNKDAYWEYINYICATDDCGQTGNKLCYYRDVNPRSETYDYIKAVVIWDDKTCVPNTDAVWELTSYVCETDDYGQTGNKICYYTDKNPRSKTYRRTTETVYIDPSTCKPNTNPYWSLTSYECETDDYGQTGNKINTLKDMNPRSETYNTTKEETVLDETTCVPNKDAYWSLTTHTCLTDAYGQTGYMMGTYIDLNPRSETYNTEKSEIVLDEEKCVPNKDAYWEITSYVCETDDYGQTGNKINTLKDMNPRSETYNTTKEETVKDETTCVPNTDAYWKLTTYACETDDYGQTGYMRGTYIDLNPRSETYNTEKTEIVLDETTCVPNKDASWKLTMSYCETDDYGQTGNRINIFKDMNPRSETYDTEKTEIVLDEEKCIPNKEAYWEYISHTCETDDYGQTGNRINTLKDMNPRSETYDTTKTETVKDETTCVPNTDAYWKLTTYACETDEYGQTGYKMGTYIDMNPRSETYGTTKTETVKDESTCKPNTDSYWVTESTECETTE